ncbi:MAG: single-stranded-DNA-specific exonuclease RecJ, partial [Eubacterium sp.]
NIDPFIAFLLVTRGIDDELTASDFLSESCRFVSPFSFADMDKAVERINKAIDFGEKICIWGDYDCDGVTATALLYTFLQSMGADVCYYIPNRISDGYGMNIPAIEKIAQMGTNLIVTVDNGISSFDEADYVKNLGMELVITDHHQIGEKLPDACAVVNPHRTDNNIDFKDYAGVGVAFKLACALYDSDADDLLEQFADLVTIGTIGDVVSLKGENRSIVKAGLEMINSSSRIGIAALREAAYSADSFVSALDVAFQICPRINAAGRMDNAQAAVELLISDDWEDAKFKAQQLNTENTHRHEVESNILDDILYNISCEPSLAEDRVIVVCGKGYHKGVIGITAAHLCELYGKPVIVIGIDENGEATGSARSIDGFNIFEAISSCSDILTHFGGHPLAAGLGILPENIDLFRKQINEYATEKYPVMPIPSLRLDCKLSPFYMNVDLVDSLSALEPYGADNPQPVFGLYNMVLKSVTPIGDGKHIRLEVTKKNKAFRIVKFKTSADEFPYKAGDCLDFAVRLSKNLYKGKYYLSVQALDVRKNGCDTEKYFNEKNDLELFMLGRKNKTELYPDREVCKNVYLFLKRNDGWKYSIEDLYFELADSLTYGQLVFALDAFEEVGIITRNGKITINNIGKKADMDNTKTLKSLKGRL